MMLPVSKSGLPIGLRKSRMFWILNGAFWLFFILREILVIRYYEPDFPEFYWLASITYLSGFLITLVLRYLFIYRLSRIRSLLNMALWFGSVLIITSVFWRFLDALISYPFWSEQIRAKYISFSWMDHVMESFQYLLTMLVWGAVYYIVFLFERIVSQEVKAQQAEALAMESRFRMLQNQLNPHFLFNSLNSIRALIFENQQKAADLVTDLSGFLRYNLQQSASFTIPLEEEIDALKTYLSIEQKRYEDDLRISVDMESGTEGFRVIPNLLLPLVDNAVKHGIQTSAMPLDVTVTARMNGKNLHLEVTNSGSWNTRNGIGEGVGLKNVEERLQNLYGNAFLMQVIREENRVRVVLEIPDHHNKKPIGPGQPEIHDTNE
ncbi:MAG: hypothetical protein EOM90_13910 [Alphaproteobacteria bacterium]|nr:hypothetical protein [Alphaproteobacteria bacterium]